MCIDQVQSPGMFIVRLLIPRKFWSSWPLVGQRYPEHRGDILAHGRRPGRRYRSASSHNRAAACGTCPACHPRIPSTQRSNRAARGNASVRPTTEQAKHAAEISNAEGTSTSHAREDGRRALAFRLTGLNQAVTHRKGSSRQVRWPFQPLPTAMYQSMMVTAHDHDLMVRSPGVTRNSEMPG